MAKTIKIGASFSGKISTGQYENANPGFYVEEILDNCDLTDDQIFERQQHLHNRVYDQFKQHEQRAIIERVQKEREDIRFYQKDGMNLPSVTSILDFDADFWHTEEEMKEYCAQGALIDYQSRHFIRTKKWVPVDQITEAWTDLLIVKKGKLKLTTSGWDFPSFVKEYQLTNLKEVPAVYSTKYKYAGTPDFACIYKKKNALCDWKRTKIPVRTLMQLAAYDQAYFETFGKRFDVLMGVILNSKTKQGFSEPLVETRRQKINGYLKMFLEKRSAFERRYGA